MNVLVYGGPDSPALALLRGALLPHYAVQPVTAQALAGQPWHVNCALLVVQKPSELHGGKAITAIQTYVQGGGAFLGLSTGAALSPTAASGLDPVLQLYLQPGRYLRFDGPSFASHDNEDQVSSTVDVEDLAGTIFRGIPLDPKNALAGFAGEAGVQAVLRYGRPAPQTGRAGDAALNGEKDSCPAAVQLAVGSGRVAVVAPDLCAAAAAGEVAAPAPTSPAPSHVSLLLPVLASLGLRIPTTPAPTGPPRPQPQYLTSHPAHKDIVHRITRSLAAAQTEERRGGPSQAPTEGQAHANADTLASQLSVWEDSGDTFCFYPLAGAKDAVRAAAQGEDAQRTRGCKSVVLCADAALPPRELTPHFDLGAFYGALDEARRSSGASKVDDGGAPWGIGDALIYSEAVTSTQTMLEKNPSFRYALPTPVVSLAYAQLSGRGRGGNVWLSPAGCLQFSILLRVPLSQLPAQKLVFVQYLFALAVAEACEGAGVLGAHGRRVRIKWPNDVYAEVGRGEAGEPEFKKIGGILVNTGFNGANADIIIGSGLNVLNEPPIPSLAQLLPCSKNQPAASTPAPPPTLERTAAAILARFDGMWAAFVAGRGDFAPFEARYLAKWLHSDQPVTITTVDPPLRARIVGITEHGLLRALPERGSGGGGGRGYGGAASRAGTDGQFIDLQLDGNSFDIMSGMIKAKR
ncbi:hypothetical protein HDZ31DRAFT_29697 [Schizophyllum fasciatum]